MQPLVSVIIAVYRVEAYLRKCVSSVIDQSYKNLEILLIDDGSPDSCGNICDEYGKDDHRIVVIHKENGGVVSARKCGLNRATGQYTLFIDGDDWLESGLIEKMVTEAETNKADIVIDSYKIDYGNRIEVERLMMPVGVYKDSELPFFRKNVLSMGSFYHFGINPAVWNKLVKTELMRSIYINVPDELSLGEDFAVTMPYMSKTNCAVVIDSNYYYHYVQRPDSMVKAFDSRLLNKIQILISYIEHINTNDDFWARLDDYYTWLIFELLKNQAKVQGKKSDIEYAIRDVYSIPNVKRIIEASHYKTGKLGLRLLFDAFVDENVPLVYLLLWIQKYLERF